MKPRTKRIVRWGSALLVLAWIGEVGLAEFNDVGITAAALIFATYKFKNA